MTGIPEKILPNTRAVSATAWAHHRRNGHTLVRDGQRYVLRLDFETGGEMLEPVRIIGEPKIPAADRQGLFEEKRDED